MNAGQGVAGLRSRSSGKVARPSTGTTICACGGRKTLQAHSCRACNTAYRNQPENLVHGTEGAASGRGCKCPECLAACRYIRRIRRWAGLVTVHNLNGYKNGCRCETCRSAEKASRPRKAQARS